MFSSFPIKTFLGSLGAGLAYLVGGWDKGIQYLVLAITLDYLFGVLTAVYNKKYSYDTAWRGILKKVGFFGIVAVSVLMERMSGVTNLFHPLVCYYLVGNEVFSMIKSFKDLGLPIPDIFEKEAHDLFDKLKGSGTHEG